MYHSDNGDPCKYGFADYSEVVDTLVVEGRGAIALYEHDEVVDCEDGDKLLGDGAFVVECEVEGKDQFESLLDEVRLGLGCCERDC